MYGSVDDLADNIFGGKSLSWRPKVNSDSVGKQSVPLQEVVSKEIKESVFKDRIGLLSMESAVSGGIGHISMESVGPGVSLSKEIRFSIETGVSFYGNKNSFHTGKGVSFYGNSV